MSNQEQQFYSQEQYPPSPEHSYEQSYQYSSTPEGMNADPREQPQHEMYGGYEYRTGQGEKLQLHPSRRRGSRALWIVPFIVMLFIGGMSFGIFSRHEQFHGGFASSGHEQQFNREFDHQGYEQSVLVGDAPKLIIYDANGAVHVHTSADSSNTHTVTVLMNGSQRFGSNPVVKFDKQSDTVTIDVTQQEDDNASLDITVPSASNVQVNDPNGDVNVENVAGGVNVNTTQGRIDANNISGQVTLSSTDGDVSVENGSLSGQSSLHSDNGNIRYNGSIAAQGSYKFDTVNGSVDVGLPSDTVFHLNASSTNGNNENEFGSNDVGSGTRPQLTISSANGSIHVSKNG